MRSPTGLYRCSYTALVRWVHQVKRRKRYGHERHQDPRRQVATARCDRRRRARGARRRRCSDRCDPRLVDDRRRRRPRRSPPTPPASSASPPQRSPPRSRRRWSTRSRPRSPPARSRRRRPRQMEARLAKADAPLFALGGGTGDPAATAAAARRARRAGSPSTPRRRYIGVTTAELRTQLEAGKTLAAIATDNGKTADGLKAALTTAAKKDLDAAVTAGRLTQAAGGQDPRRPAGAPRPRDQRGPHRRPRAAPAARPPPAPRPPTRRPDRPISSRRQHDSPPSTPSPGRPPSLRGSARSPARSIGAWPHLSSGCAAHDRTFGARPQRCWSRLRQTPVERRAMLIEHAGRAPARSSVRVRRAERRRVRRRRDRRRLPHPVRRRADRRGRADPARGAVHRHGERRRARARRAIPCATRRSRARRARTLTSTAPRSATRRSSRPARRSSRARGSGPARRFASTASLHVNSSLPAGAELPIGWVAVGDPAQMFPPKIARRDLGRAAHARLRGHRHRARPRRRSPAARWTR